MKTSSKQLAVATPETNADPRPVSIRISLVEDDDEVREGVAFLLKKTPEFVCVSSYSSAEDALKGIPTDVPDVVLMDINLPAMSGVECVRQLTARLPNLIVLMLTVYEDTEAIFQSLTAGASGYLLKRTTPPELIDAIRQARNGNSPMSGHIARKVVQYFHQRPPPKPDHGLSPREQEVLEQLAKGYLYKEIATRLGISIDTVRKHLGQVYQKLHVNSRTEAVIKFLGVDDRGYEKVVSPVPWSLAEHLPQRRIDPSPRA